MDIENANLTISPDFKQSLKIKANGDSIIGWDEAQTDGLSAELSNGADLLVKGKIATTSLIVDNASAHFVDFNGRSVSLDMKGADARTDWKGQADNFIIRSAKNKSEDRSNHQSIRSIFTDWYKERDYSFWG